MFIQTCAYEYMRDNDGGVMKYRPISTNTGHEAKWGGDDGGNASYRLWFFCEKECRWPYPLWGLARAKGVDGVPHETRGVSLSLFLSLAPYLSLPSYACETNAAKCTAAVSRSRAYAYARVRECVCVYRADADRYRRSIRTGRRALRCVYHGTCNARRCFRSMHGSSAGSHLRNTCHEVLKRKISRYLGSESGIRKHKIGKNNYSCVDSKNYIKVIYFYIKILLIFDYIYI